MFAQHWSHNNNISGSRILCAFIVIYLFSRLLPCHQPNATALSTALPTVLPALTFISNVSLGCARFNNNNNNNNNNNKNWGPQLGAFSS